MLKILTIPHNEIPYFFSIVYFILSCIWESFRYGYNARYNNTM